MSEEARRDIYVVTAPGLEAVTAREVESLGLPKSRTLRGGLETRATLSEIARCNLHLRTASRVLLRLAAFDAPGRRELAARTRRLPVETFLTPGVPIRIEATSSKSRLYHTGLIAEVLHEVLGCPEATTDDAPTIFVRIERDRCTLSIDTTGPLLHRRGYREETSHAPLRETLAAGLLMLSGFDGESPFLDPMCGSGTIAIEAAWMAMKKAPGIERSFALQQFPSFDPSQMESLKDEARAAVRPLKTPVFASDIHAGALAAAQRNAERAGVTISFERSDVASRTAPATSGWLVTNPPYGKRVGREQDDSLPALARGLDGAFRSWRAASLVPAAARVPAQRPVLKETRLENGGIPVRLVEWVP